jgi:glycosyltransferase involved in cell wall biosynthesis
MMERGVNCERQCLKCKVLTRARKIKSSFVNHVVGNSSHTLQAHLQENYFQNANSSVISGGLDDSYLYHSGKKDALNCIGYIGQIIPSKGVEDILKLAVQTNSTVRIAGNHDGEYASRLVEKYSIYPNITWLGHVDALEFYSSIDILVVTSIWAEPLPRVIYEAMSQGVAVLATDVGGNPEIMTGDLSAFLYSPGDIEMLVKKYNMLRNMMTNEFSSRLIVESRKYSSENVSDKYLEIYKELSND